MNTLLKILGKFIILGIPLIILCAVTCRDPMGYMSTEYAMWAEEKDVVTGKALLDGSFTEPETIIIGDSRAKSGLMPLKLNSENRVYNIAIGGATPIEMYHAVKHYLENHEKPENAFVLFSPYHFYEIDNWGQTLYYNYLSVGEIASAEADALKFNEKKLLYTGWVADILSFKLRFPNKYLDAVYSAHLTGNRDENLKKYGDVRNALGYTAFGEEEYNDKLSYEAHEKDFKPRELSCLYYYKLLDLLSSEGINIVVEQSPVNEASDKKITTAFRDSFRSFMESVQNKYPGIYVEKEIPVYGNEYFGDSNHMNFRGAEKFSDAMKEKHGSIFYNERQK